MNTTTSKLLTVLPFFSVLSVAGVLAFSDTRVPLGETPILTGSYQRAYEESFSANVPLTILAQNAYTTATIALFGEAGSEVVIAARDWVFTAEEFRAPSQLYALQEELLSTRNVLSEHGITLVPLIVPDKARVYADLLPRPRARGVEARYNQSLDLLAELGFPVADLSTQLILARAIAPTYMRTDTHWSPFGAETVARVLAEAVGLRGAGETLFETTFSAAEPFDGDLRPFVETGPFRDLAGPAEETIQRPTTVALDTDLGLFGEMQIDAVLIGTSFSARSDFNFDGFLQVETGLNIVNLAVEGQGPFAPMRNALADGSIFELNPNIVFWEIPERYLQIRSLQ